MSKYLHGGDIYRYPDTIDFSANCNPYGTPQSVKQAVYDALDQVRNYPDTEYCRLREAIGEYEKVPAEQIICGNGAADLIFSLMIALKPKKALITAPTFSEYEQSLEAAECDVERWYLSKREDFVPDEHILERITDDMDIVIICNPNNPTGILWEPELLEKIYEKCKECHCILMVDECFIDFVEDSAKYSMKKYLDESPNLFILKAFTKKYAMAGVRLGYGLSSNGKLLDKMKKVTQPWNVSILASEAGVAALKEEDFVKKTIETIHTERKYLISELKKMNFGVYDSKANYIFFRGPDDLWKKCLEKGFLIRDCSNYPGLDRGYYRIAVRLHKENEELIRTLKEFTTSVASYRTMKEGRAMAKAIMIQGTMSNVGKSLITAGLCRIFKQDGYKVAPFKSQNMALNSYVTEKGLEMGRAQVMQAEAAGIRPTVEMNPILLKPTNEMGSQVILNGEILDSMAAKEYYFFKKKLVPHIMKAYNSLAEDYDIIVIEGAGSTAEINLNQDDIVNMGMAKMANAPVILVGDIDRGGVFAQMVGTLQLLEDKEKNMVKGLIINKFRGKTELMDTGIKMLEEKTGKPVLGLVHHIDVQVEDEDSLTKRFEKSHEVGLIDIVVIKTPHISNFTDFNVLEMIPGVSLRYVHRVADIKDPDMIIIPGSKNTMDDLLWMRKNGIEASIIKRAKAGKLVFGICGGYQMLGETISDPMGVEAGGSIKGMGLLPVNTVYQGKKTRTRVSGVFKATEGILSNMEGVSIEGYEIHMGRTTLKSQAHALTCITDQLCGKTQEDGAWKENVYGTYVHGVFDKEEAAKALIENIAKYKNIDMESGNHLSFNEFKETQYDLLAEELRKQLDIDKIYEILENGI